MRPSSLRSAFASAQGYVCPSCRLQTARSLQQANRRYQHADSSPKSEQQDNPLTEKTKGSPAARSSFADRMQLLMSSDLAKKADDAALRQDMRTLEPGKPEKRQNPAKETDDDGSLPGLLAKLFADRESRHRTSKSVEEHVKEVVDKTPILLTTNSHHTYRRETRKILRRLGKKLDNVNVYDKLRSEVAARRKSQRISVHKRIFKIEGKLVGDTPMDLAKAMGVPLESLASSKLQGIRTQDIQKSAGIFQAGATETSSIPEFHGLLDTSTADPPVMDEVVHESKESPRPKNAKKSEKASKPMKTEKAIMKDGKIATKKSGARSKASEVQRKAEVSEAIKAKVENLHNKLEKTQAREKDKKFLVRKMLRPVVTKVVDKTPPKARELSSDVTSIRKHNSTGRVPTIAAPRIAGIGKSSPTVIATASAAELKITPVDIEQPPVPSLAHGLERVLFNPGVYQLQDPRSRVYNFDPYLQKIMPVAEFDFNALKEYITSSRDESLQKIAKQQGKRYVGSTSSMTGILAHFHFLLSQWRSINVSMLSKSFPDQSFLSFTEIQRTPAAIFLRWKNGSYAIDADKEFDTSNVLSMLGKSMEKLLTLKTEDFERYRRSSSGTVPEEELNSPESFHYSTLGDFLMRSQLDAHDTRLPGTGMFDLKTRAVVSVRMDVANYEHGTGYEIKSRHGEWESYEREYYDMIRAAFLKYSMQVRMGRMDGIFVAFHNIERIFGFQYISLPEIDNTIHGQSDTSIGDQEFALGLDLLNKILDKATKKFPQTSVRLHFETRDAATPFMYIFAEPVTEEQAAEIQTANRAKAAEFERHVLGRSQTQDDGPKWADIQANVEEAMDKDELALDESGEETSDSVDDQQSVVDHGPLYTNESIVEGEEGLGSSSAEDGEDVEEDAEDEEGEDVNEKEQDVDDENNGEDAENEVNEKDEEAEVDALAEAEHSNDHTIACTEGIPVSTQEENIEAIENDITAKQASEEVLSSNNTDEAERASPNTESEASTAPTEVSTPSSEVRTLDSYVQNDPSKFGTEADRPFLDILDSEQPAVPDSDRPADDVLAMTLTIRNKVNGHYVLRPTEMTAKDKWEVEYSLIEVPTQARAKALYEACKVRRQKKLDQEVAPEGQEEVLSGYVKRLREMSANGRAWREEMETNEREGGEKVKVLGREPEDLP